MFGSKKNSAASTTASTGAASEKELQKLRRMDLLELLIGQIRENEMQAAELVDLRDLTERLKAKLDEKDAQIERLKSRLDQKDAEIAHLHEVNSATARANGLVGMRDILDIEKFAVEEYLKQIASLSKAAPESVPAPVENATPEPASVAVPEAVSEPVPAPAAKAAPVLESIPDPMAAPEPAPMQAPDSEPEPESDPDSDPTLELEPITAPEPDPEPAPEFDPMPAPEPKPITVPELDLDPDPEQPEAPSAAEQHEHLRESLPDPMRPPHPAPGKPGTPQ